MNQSTNNSTVVQSQLSKLMDKTYLSSDHQSQMRDVLSITLKDRQQKFKNEISMIQAAKDQISTSVYMSNLQKERADQYDIVLAQRKFIWKQEEKLYQQIDELRNTNKRYQDSVNHYGIKNYNLETEVKAKFDEVQSTLNSVQDQKLQVLKNFDQIQQSLVSSKSKLSSNGQLVIQGNQEYDQLVDFIRQQEKKVGAMKLEYNDPAANQIIPFDKKLQQMAENTFEKQARFLYQGTKFEGNDQQKLAALSTLRRKIEQYIDKRGLNGVVLDMPFKLDMNKEQESAHKVEYNQTLAEIDQVRKDYIQSGGTDPNYLIAVNNLERYYKNNHPIGMQAMPSKLEMNLEERGQITQNPVFQYLPETFKKEVLDLENRANIQREADLRNPQMNKDLLKAPVEVGDSSRADEMMLENLRQQEAELMLVMNQSQQHRAKFDEIQRLKQIYEHKYLEKKVQEQLAQRQVEEDVLNFKSRPQDKLNYLQYLQGQIGTMPLFYDPDAGFALRIDFVHRLPVCYDYVKISYGVFIKNIDQPKTTQNTNQHECSQDNIFAKKSVVQERFVERNHDVFKDTYLYLVLWGYSQDFGSGMVPIEVGWTIHKIFDEENLISGCFLLPFYSTAFTFDLLRQPEVQEIKVGIRMSMPGDAVLDLNNNIMNVVDYKVQQMHIKQVEVIEQERQFKFKEYRVFPLPKEFIHTQFNDPKLWQSELPPNVYKLLDYNFLNEEQAALKAQQMEYEERRMNRLNRPARRRFMGKQGTIARTPAGEKKKTILTFRQRMAQKKGTVTPSKAKSKEKEQSRPGSKADSSRTKADATRSTQRVQEKEKSAIIPTKPRKITFKLRSVSQIYVGGIQTLTLKLALFSGIKLLEDDGKNMCVYSKELEPDEKGDNYFNYTETYTFDLNLTEFFEEEEEQDILAAYLFIALFKDVTNLFGWQAVQVFETSDEHFKIKSGIYYENLLGPPGQAPPFNLNRTKRLNAQINFILMQDDDRVLQLPTFDNYKLDQKLLTEEDREKRKKIYSVANPKWNTQIRLDISKFRNFTSKDEFIMKTIVIEEDNIIIDAIDRQCIKFDHVELFEGTGKGEFIANHTIILRIGSRYLVDTFTTTFKKLNYLFSFFIKQQIVGVCQFPLFANNGALNTGSQKLMVHDLDDSGKIGKKTTKEMYVFISEEQLNLKDVEETPKYAQQTKEQKIVNKQDQSKYLIIEIDQLTDYIQEAPVDFTVQVYNGEEPAMDSDGVICAYTSSESYAPKPNYSVPINETVYFKMPINAIIEKKQGLENYQVFISFSEMGWISFQLFLNGELNASDFVGKLFKGEVPAPPVDYTNMKKINTKVSYFVKYDLKQQEEFKRSVIEDSRTNQRSGTQKIQQQSLPSEQISKIASRRTVNSKDDGNKVAIFLINVNGFINISRLYIKGILMTEGKTLLDKNNQACSFKSELINNVNKVAFFGNVHFIFQIDTSNLGMESYIFLSVLDEKDTIVAWYGKRLVTAVGKITKGMQFEFLYAPPLMRPPLNKDKIQSLPQSIQFEIK